MTVLLSFARDDGIGGDCGFVGMFVMDDAEHTGDQAGEQPGQDGGRQAHEDAANGDREGMRDDGVEGSVAGLEVDPVDRDGDIFEECVAELVAIPVDRADGDGVGNPAGQHGDGEIDAEEDGRDGGDDHVEGDGGGKADKHAEAQAAAEGALVEIPQLAGDAMLADQTAQQPMGAMLMVIQLIVKKAS